MTKNPFLDPDKEIVQGRSDSDILRQRVEEAAEDAAHKGGYTPLSGTSMAGEYSGSLESVARGIEYAVKYADDVIVAHISLGNPTADAVIVKAFKYAQSKGLVVTAAGSDGSRGGEAPGATL